MDTRHRGSLGSSPLLLQAGPADLPAPPHSAQPARDAHRGAHATRRRGPEAPARGRPQSNPSPPLGSLLRSRCEAPDRSLICHPERSSSWAAKWPRRSRSPRRPNQSPAEDADGGARGDGSRNPEVAGAAHRGLRGCCSQGSPPASRRRTEGRSRARGGPRGHGHRAAPRTHSGAGTCSVPSSRKGSKGQARPHLTEFGSLGL